MRKGKNLTVRQWAYSLAWREEAAPDQSIRVAVVVCESHSGTGGSGRMHTPPSEPPHPSLRPPARERNGMGEPNSRANAVVHHSREKDRRTLLISTEPLPMPITPGFTKNHQDKFEQYTFA